jgi:hypothetical protein
VVTPAAKGTAGKKGEAGKCVSGIGHVKINPPGLVGGHNQTPFA